MDDFGKILLTLSQEDRRRVLKDMDLFGSGIIRLTWNKDEGRDSAKADVLDPLRLMVLPILSSKDINDTTCPDCGGPLVKHFDGEQTYIQCTAEPQCSFHSLYGDGDLTK